jgi:hypothetical protein
VTSSSPELRPTICAAILAIGLGIQASVTLATGEPPPSANPVYAYVITPKSRSAPRPGYPTIFTVKLNKQHFSSHDEIQMQVITSVDVVKVTNHELGHGGTLRQVSPGVFLGQGRVTAIPFFMRGMHVAMHYTATTANGNATTVIAHVTF